MQILNQRLLPHRPAQKTFVFFAKWYGGEHKAPSLQAEAVYGLTELARDDVRGARLVANPGCYPTAAQLPLIALLKVRPSFLCVWETPTDWEKAAFSLTALASLSVQL